jgi:hypothetical protein
MDRLIKEAIEIRLHPNSIDREEGFKLTQAWNPAIKILQTNTRRDRSRNGQEKRQANTGQGAQDLTPGQVIYMYIYQQFWSFLKLALKMETELVFETLAFDSTLTWLMAR